MKKVNKEWWYDEETCFHMSMNGRCGLDCPVFLRGKCDEPDDLLEDLMKSTKFSEMQKKEILVDYTNSVL